MAVGKHNKVKSQLPYWLDKNKLDFHASTREVRGIKGEEKFKYLINRDIPNLIKPSIEDSSERKSNRFYRKNLNKILRDKAILILDTDNFVKDVTAFAKSHALWEVRYELYPTDVYEYVSSPIINAWNSRLKYLSLLRWQSHYKSDIKHFRDAYLPPKVVETIKDIMDNYGLDFFWYESFVHLLLTGVWYLPRNSSVIYLKIAKKYRENICADLFLQISSLTSKEEVNYRWEEIFHLKKQLFPTTGERIKTRRDIEKLFAYKFRGELGSLAETSRLKRSVKGYRNSLETIQKTIVRSKKDYRDFLLHNREVPPNLLNQMDTFNEWLDEYYFF